MKVPLFRSAPKRLTGTAVPALYELTVIGAVTLAYTLLFNLPLLRVAYMSGCHSFSVFVRCMFSLFGVGGLFLMLSLNRYVFTASMPILFGVTSIASYFILQYDIIINQNTIALLLGTNLREVVDLATLDLAAWVLVHTGAGLFFGLMLLRRRSAVSPAGKAVLVLSCLFLGFCSYRTEPFWSPSAEVLPFNLVFETVQYGINLSRMEKISRNRSDFPVGFSAGLGEMTVVLIIGESSRSDHFHINGYARHTSPGLERRGAVAFPHVRSLYQSTNKSIPVMFSRFDPYSGEKIEQSLVTAFSRAGFATSWLSVQAYVGKYDLGTATIIRDAATARFININGDADYSVSNDGQLLKILDNVLKSGPGKKLIVLHTLGSHWRYDNHYPAAFRKFIPTAISGFNPCLIPNAYLINSYDNSILYTDYIIGQVIDRVKDSVSLVLFVSDHGESLGEDGMYLHAAKDYREEQRRVAMFAWASKRYRACNGGRYRSMLANRMKCFTHRALFHSILAGAGISSQIIDPAKNLFGSAFVEEPLVTR